MPRAVAHIVRLTSRHSGFGAQAAGVQSSAVSALKDICFGAEMAS